MSEDRLTYRFGPLERRGLLGPLTAGQAGLLTAAAGIAVTILDRAPSPGGALLALVLVLGAGGAALAPLARRSLSEWVPIVALLALRRALGLGRFTSPAPTAGMVANVRSRRAPRVTAAHPPPTLHGTT